MPERGFVVRGDHACKGQMILPWNLTSLECELSIRQVRAYPGDAICPTRVDEDLSCLETPPRSHEAEGRICYAAANTSADARMNAVSQITDLLNAANSGDAAAQDAAYELVYAELKRCARRQSALASVRRYRRP